MVYHCKSSRHEIMDYDTINLPCIGNEAIDLPSLGRFDIVNCRYLGVNWLCKIVIYPDNSSVPIQY